MAVIKPTFTLVSNASTASSCAGPLSVGLNLTAQPLVDGGSTGCYGITCGQVKSSVITVSDTAATLFQDVTETGGTAGTHGCFIYMKNVSAADHDIYIGAKASGSEGAGATELEAADDADRLFTLKQGEFAWFPYDFVMDITIDSENAAAKLEWWFFNRA